MTDGALKEHPCQRADAAAYLDGELDAAASHLFEQHVKECASCAAALSEQRNLLCLLGIALDETLEKKLSLPKNFSQVVAARAQTDMSGVRRRSEHRRAFAMCVLLAATAFCLLGATMLDVAFAPVAAAVRGLASVLGMIGHGLADVGASAAVILRTIGGRFIAEPNPLRFLQWMLFAGAVGLLLRLIGSYHRARH